MSDGKDFVVVDDALIKLRDGDAVLVGGKCRGCGAVTLRVRRFCPTCWAENSQEEVELQGQGTLYSYAVIRHAPEGFTAPYTVGLVDLADGLRLFARIASDGGPAVGTPMRLELGEVAVNAEGRRVLGPVFRSTHTGRPT